LPTRSSNRDARRAPRVDRRCLTPESSRFWPADGYVTGKSPPSFDKQFVRDYLETLAWDKTPPAPSLPPEVIEKTSQKYRDAFLRLTGADLVT
jgi:phosphoribosylaminoimidazole-succinocarboxamide synthase